MDDAEAIDAIQMFIDVRIARFSGASLTFDQERISAHFIEAIRYMAAPTKQDDVP